MREALESLRDTTLLVLLVAVVVLVKFPDIINSSLDNFIGNVEQTLKLEQTLPPEAKTYRANTVVRNTNPVQSSSVTMLLDMATKIVEYTNTYRENQGIATVTTSSQLQQAAKLKCTCMASTQTFNHDHTCGGHNMMYFLRQAGYTKNTAAENTFAVGKSSATAEATINEWITSPGHNANLISPSLSRIGVAVCEVETGKRYFVQIFGK